MIDAHFNGGPYDDRCYAVPRDVFYVPLMQVRLSLLPPPDPNTPIEPSMRTGVYKMRIDSNGDLVPHNLAGVIEYDWQM